MAGLETQHKIIEAFEVKGAVDAEGAFDKIAKSADGAAKAFDSGKTKAEKFEDGLSEVEEKWFKAGEAGEKSGSKWADAWGKAKEGILGSIGPMVKQLTIANLLSKAIEWATQKVKEFVRQGWQINVAYEAATSRVQGLALGLLDFGKGATTAEKVQKSQKLANVAMAEFKDIGMETATQLPKIEAAYARLTSVLSGTGATQREILEYTRKTAGAAKVYGENAEVAGGIISKAIFEGVVEGESAFAKAFKAQAGVTSKMNLEERMNRVNATLAKMSEAVGVVTDDTAGAQERWKILSNDILQRVTYPIYQKIGESTKAMVKWLQANEDTINEIVHEIQEWLYTAFEVKDAIFEVVGGVVVLWWKVNRVGDTLRATWERFKLIRQAISLIVTGVRLLVEQVAVLADPNRGMGKLSALSEAIRVKWREIALQIVKVFRSLAKLAIPEFVRKRVPGLGKFFTGLDETVQEMESYNKQAAKRLRAMEKKLGLSPLTETTRTIADVEQGRGLDKAARDAFLKGLKGLKFNQNIGQVNIRQDFRDQDPDRVLVEFVTDLERLGETALQSTVGGGATVFEGGGSF